MEIRALRFHGVGDLRLEQVPLAAPGRGEVLARVEACGVCGSDLHFLDGTARTKHVPITLGHEIAAAVVESHDERWPPGADVLVRTGIHCGSCARCRTGRPNLCASLLMIGVEVDGGMADAIVVPGEALVARPPGVDVAAAAIAMDAGVTAYHAVARRGSVKPADAVAIVGIGGLGTFAVQIAKRLGAAPIVAVDTSLDALERARASGADEIVHAGEPGSVGRRVKLLTDGGVDVAIEFVGQAASLDAAIKSLRPGGVAVAVGVGNQPLATLPNVLWATNEYELRGSLGGLPGDAETVLGWLAAGELVPPPSEGVPIDEAADRIVARASGAEEGGSRLVVVP